MSHSDFPGIVVSLWPCWLWRCFTEGRVRSAALPIRTGSDCYERLRFGLPAMPGWRRPPWLPAPLRVGPGFGPRCRHRVLRPVVLLPYYRQRLFVEHHLGESSGSAVAAARRAGYPRPEKPGPQLVEKSPRNAEFISQKRPERGQAVLAYWPLATLLSPLASRPTPPAENWVRFASRRPNPSTLSPY